MNAWILAARPKTLTASVVPVLVGTSLAVWEQARIGSELSLPFERALLAILSACAIQVGTNYINDAIDFKRGADTVERLGPARATQLGLLTAQQMMRGAYLAFMVATISGAILVALSGPAILVIGLLSLLFGYAYTGGPYPLAYRGLGDLFVLIFFGIVAVMGSVFLQLGSWPVSGLVAGIQVGLLAVVLIAINNFRDCKGDRAVDKRTLAVVLGEQLTRYEIALATFIPLMLGVYWLRQGAYLAAVLPFLSFPSMLRVVRGMWNTSPSAECNRFLVLAATAHAVFGCLFAAGLILGALWR